MGAVRRHHVIMSFVPLRRHWTQANYYVSPTGLDTNNGTSPTSAFATIAHAASVVSAGQIVEVLDGTYNLSAGMFMANTITAHQEIRLLFVPRRSMARKLPATPHPEQAIKQSGSFVEII